MASQPGRGARTENKLRNGLLATAGAAALMLGAPQAANATSYALSQLDVRNLIVSGIPAFGTFFSFSASVSATLEDTTGGFSASDGPEGPHSAGPVLAPFSLDRGISPGLVMDPALASVTLGGGGPIPAENSFTPIGYTGFPGLPSYSYADHILTDTLINGLPVGLPTFGGDWEGIAETAVVGDVKGAGLSGNLQSWNSSSRSLRPPSRSSTSTSMPRPSPISRARGSLAGPPPATSRSRSTSSATPLVPVLRVPMVKAPPTP